MRYLSLLLFLILSFQTAQAEMFDKIVAVVNDEPITQSELQIYFAPVYQKYTQNYRGFDIDQKLEEARLSVLQKLIEDKLIYQEAMRRGLEIDDSEIQEQVDEMMASYEDEVTFRKKLHSEGMTMSNLRERFKRQIAIKKMTRYEVFGKIVISPQEVAAYYEKNQDQFKDLEKVKVRTILKKKSDAIEDEVVFESMQKIMDRLRAGEDFASVAKEVSEDSSAQFGGMVGFVSKNEMIEEIDHVIFNTPVGKFTDIIETSLGFHVFLIEGKQEEKVSALDDVHKQISDILYRERAEEDYKNWIKKLKEDAYISFK